MRQLNDVAVLTRRNLVHIAREPLRLSDVTIQPILFTLLFVYVIGAGVVLPHGGSYTGFAIAGLLALNRLAPGRQLGVGARWVWPVPALQLRPLVGLCLPRNDQRKRRVRAGNRSRHSFPARDRL